MMVWVLIMYGLVPGVEVFAFGRYSSRAGCYEQAMELVGWGHGRGLCN